MITEFDGKYRFLSNFYPAPVTYEGYLYRTVEHAFQASKSLDPACREVIANCKSPALAKEVGRKVDLRHDWKDIKVSVMLRLLRQKFSEPTLQHMLLLTAGEDLVEGNWWGDTFWGVCRGQGENQLGKLLMQVREELKNDQKGGTIDE